MLHSPIRFVHWLLSGKLYHCVFCRLQFYDRRAVRPRATRSNAESESENANKARMAS